MSWKITIQSKSSRQAQEHSFYIKPMYWKGFLVHLGLASWTDDLCQNCWSRLHACVCTSGIPTKWKP